MSTARKPSYSRVAVGPVRLADALGWGSAALGAPMLAAPRRFLREIGVKDDDRAVRWTLFVGVREQLALLNIVANRQRRIGAWSRVLGDQMDMALLVAAHRHKRADGDRLRRAMGVVGTLMLLDLYTAVRLTRADGSLERVGSRSEGVGMAPPPERPHTHVRTALTIRRPEADVRRAFAEFEWTAFDPSALLEAGEVRFEPAPGDRGTELHVDHDPAPRGGAVGAAAAKLAGRSPDQVINDELRRFKSQLETGVLARSETSPEGPSSTRQILHKSRPAQPTEQES